MVEVDGRPLSRWGCDGVVVATPTGSTAYAFSAGGPVVWPEVEAMLLVPLSAHALFARPLVRGARRRTLAVEVIPHRRAPAWCGATAGGRLELRPGAADRGRAAARHRCGWPGCTEAPFTDRLVAKFGLPVEGWRGSARERGPARSLARGVRP